MQSVAWGPDAVTISRGICGQHRLGLRIYIHLPAQLQAAATATLKYIPTRISFEMATTVKLQKIGNSIRATIPKDVVESLGLKPGEEMVVDAIDETILLKKRKAKNLSDLYGVLGRAEGKVKHWPTPEEIKDIWE